MNWIQRLQYVWSRGAKGGFQRRPYPEISEADAAFILRSLDLRLEHGIGYLLECIDAPTSAGSGARPLPDGANDGH